jgi:hypothetical protein
MLPKQQHHAVVANDLAAHDLVEVALQIRELARQVLELVVRDDADLGVFQRHGVAGVAVGTDAVEAQQFAGHLEARDLVAAVFAGHAGLEEAGAHRVERGEALAGVEQRLAPGHCSPGGDDVVEPLELLVGNAHRQA